MKEHNCVRKIKNEDPEDDCAYDVHDRCFGVNPMILEIWHVDMDGVERYFDNWAIREVYFCPFCGLPARPERLNPEAPKGDAIV